MRQLKAWICKALEPIGAWFLERFLPAWAKDSVYRENRILRDKLEQREREIERLNAYIDGMENGLRFMRRIVIQNGVRQ